jgi:hypothetical protein
MPPHQRAFAPSGRGGYGKSSRVDYDTRRRIRTLAADEKGAFGIQSKILSRVKIGTYVPIFPVICVILLILFNHSLAPWPANQRNQRHKAPSNFGIHGANHAKLTPNPECT